MVAPRNTKDNVTDLQADGHVNPTSEGGRDGPGREAEAGEELGEGVAERNSRPLFGDDDASPDARQVDAAALQLRNGASEALRAKLHHAWTQESNNLASSD